LSSELGFYVFAGLVLGGAALMLKTENIVHMGFLMLGTLLATAGIYGLLDAAFLAVMQVLIYAGAVTVLILFVIMLTQTRIGDVEGPGAMRGSGALIAVGLAAVLVPLQLLHDWSLPSLPNVADTTVLGQMLFRDYLLPFELASIVLLVALVGAIVLARKEGQAWK
jgi:NADH:ubiquinone oxidoreductase subunit 6 (subunit J)